MYNGNRSGIDADRLRDDLMEEAMGAFFGGGFGGAMVSVSDVKNASDDELEEMAREMGLDMRKYRR